MNKPIKQSGAVKLDNFGGHIHCGCGNDEWYKVAEAELWYWDYDDVNPHDDEQVEIYRCSMCGSFRVIKVQELDEG